MKSRKFIYALRTVFFSLSIIVDKRSSLMYLCDVQMIRTVSNRRIRGFPEGKNRKKDDEPTPNQTMTTQMVFKKITDRE